MYSNLIKMKKKKRKKEKRRVGRPTKLTDKLIGILENIVENAIYLTDEDLIMLLNAELTKKEQIAINTFRDYKNGRGQINNPIMVQFSTLIKKALIKEKIALLSVLREGEQGWQAKAWILERKFKEWNLKQIIDTDITTNGKDISLQEQIKNIVQIEFVDDNNIDED